MSTAADSTAAFEAACGTDAISVHRAHERELLRSALERCLDFAKTHGTPLASVAAALDVHPWQVARWAREASLPARLLASFERACGCHYVTEYFAQRASLMLVDLPFGPAPGSLWPLMEACHKAAGDLMAYEQGKGDPAATRQALTDAITELSCAAAHLR